MAFNPCGVTSTNQLLAREALDWIYRRGERVLGRAVFAAKCSLITRYPGNDNYYGPAYLWTLFGDPALRVKYRGLTGVRPEPDSPRPGSGLRAVMTGEGARLEFALGRPGRVRLRVFDALGRPRYGAEALMEPGRHHIAVSLPGPGAYFALLDAGGTQHCASFQVVN